MTMTQMQLEFPMLVIAETMQHTIEEDYGTDISRASCIDIY